MPGVFGTNMTTDELRTAQHQRLQWDLAQNKQRLAFYQSEVQRLEKALVDFWGGTATEKEDQT